jgi:bifunctional non-homologous end joining protein LigD
MTKNALNEYKQKRNFTVTSEPEDNNKQSHLASDKLQFVVQKHAARRLHYDFRLELAGTLKSWAVPKGPSLDHSVKRLAVEVEDHPLSYASFEGMIPEGQYGAGQVIVWDQGYWQPEGNPLAAYKKGKLAFTLTGDKLSGRWNLVRTRFKGGSKPQWLLIKEQDSAARSERDYEVTTQRPESVLSGILIDDKPSDKNTARKPAPKLTPKAIKAAVPQQFAPQLATLVSQPPPGNWWYEIKYDGYRILSRVINGDVRLFTRNGHDWTKKLPKQAAALARLKLADSWLDGELVALNEAGLPDFQLLQNAFDIGRSFDLVYYLFDAPYLNGCDLRHLPLEQRRAALQQALTTNTDKLIRYSDTFDTDYRNIYASACAMSLEGLIAKRAGSPYVSKRSSDWVKLKCLLRQEFVIVGYTDPKGSRAGFGALLLAVHDQPNGSLHYAGRVGTGFNQAILSSLHKKLIKLHQATSALPDSKAVPGASTVHWVKPTLVCEVEFGQWTKQQIIRHAVFIALRSDKPANDIVQEQALSAAKLNAVTRRSGSAGKLPLSKKNNRGRYNVAGVRISSAKRQIDKDSLSSKIDLAQFYADISPYILPQLKNRPVSLLRAPKGVDGEQFFQKHATRLSIPHIRKLDPALDPGHAALLAVDNEKALIGAVQMGSIEFHTWGATTNDMEKPDRLVLDLDPDPTLPWQNMIEATQLVLSVLDELELDSFLKTSGGKGMHIIIPLGRYHGWDSVKTFAKLLSRFMASKIPQRFVDKMGPKNRIGKIFIDYLRNHRGASTVAAYSIRARPGLPVSVPISRTELAGLQSAAQWHIGNLQQRLAQLTADPWEGYHHRQRITAALWQKLGGAPDDTQD